MKRVLFFLSFFISLSASAQYGNEWIDYDKPYFKIKVSEEGIYRINATTLNGVGLNFIDPENYVLYRNGEQIPIYVAMNGSNVSYVEFYGYGNDGELDAALFANVDDQLHDYYSLFTDEATYFLTFNDNGGNARLNPITNDLTNLPSPEPYFWYTSTRIFTDAYSAGERFFLGSDAMVNSTFGKGEGFYGGNSTQFNNSTTLRTYNISTPSKYVDASLQATLKTVVVGWTSGGHHFKVQAAGNDVDEFTFSEYDVAKSDNQIANSWISNSTPISFQSILTTSGQNRNNPSMIELTYPREFDFGNESIFAFELQGNNAKQYIEVSNINDAVSAPILYDITNGYRISAADAQGSTMYRYALPAAAGTRDLVLFTEGPVVHTISSLSQTSFTDYSSIGEQGDFIFLTNSAFSGSTALENYKLHRSSILGGGHQVIEVNIEELYDQFGFGIAKHPQSIRNFVNFIVNEWVISPESLFIIGRAREYSTFRNNASAFNACYVPTFGSPGSDNLLAANTSSIVPQLGVGRIASNQLSDLQIYLDKIIDYDTELYNTGDPYQTIENKAWQKQVLHFGGGSNSGEQSLFTNYLTSYKNQVENEYWGANVSSIFKTSSAPIQSIQSGFIQEKFEEGVSLVTFFGHSYAGGFDISFDVPENYTNTGKYPIFLSNGCFTGDIHNGASGISHNFILADQKAAIAFIATSELSSSSSLNVYSNAIYKNIADSTYNSTLGDVIKKAIQDVEICCTGNPSQPFNAIIANGMNLHGDPAIPFNQYTVPDYDIEPQKVFFSPQNISSSLDSFEIHLDIYNLGKAIDDSFDVEIKRHFPDGNQEVYVERFSAPYHNDTFSLKLPVLSNQQGVGLNEFSIYVDIGDEIANELSETNNYIQQGISLFIGSDDIYPIHPFEFCIVPTDDITLKASTGDVFAPLTDYVFQIDTSELFINPLDETTISSIGGVVEWNPSTLFQDNTVYYWRTTKQGTDNWQSSSFIYLDGETPGWNQSHYYQYQKDNYQNMYLDTDREFKYVDDVKEVRVKTGVFPTVHYEEMKWELNGARQHNWQMNNCGGGVGYPNGLSIGLINNITGLSVDVVNTSTTSSYGPYGNIHCVGVPDVRQSANFRASGSTPSNHPTPGIPWSDLIIDYLENVPVGYYVLVYSINDPNYASWSTALVNYLNAKGSSVNNASNGAMALGYQETGAAVTPLLDVVANSFLNVIDETFTISGNWYTGDIKSTLIGPALEWNELRWDYEALENPTDDFQKIEVYGVSGTTETFLFEVENTLVASLANIDASQYPYLRLKLKTEDETDRTPMQLKYWRVLYGKPPEAAINPSRYFSVTADTVNQGEIYNFSVAIENVTGTHMDSLWVKFSNVYADNSIEEQLLQFDSLRAFDTLHLSLDKNTISPQFLGANTILLEANPLSYNHQLEQHHFNNFASISYDVIGDKINPLLDVTFDGIHILDGDIVSASPEISIKLKDENQFLALNDTSLVDLYIRNTTSNQIRRIGFMQPNVLFIPADQNDLDAKNEAVITFEEDFEEDGVYELIVRSSDRSGNFSSATQGQEVVNVNYDFKISFEIINTPSISNVLNYPNPFTTQTEFVFTLTGRETPDYIEIQIMNIKGQIIQQITQDEIGPIRIGINRSEYKWDGRDQYGDLVANGVYFYKVKTSLNEESLEHFSINQVDKFFKKGIGKMVFIR